MALASILGRQIHTLKAPLAKFPLCLLHTSSKFFIMRLLRCSMIKTFSGVSKSSISNDESDNLLGGVEGIWIQTSRSKWSFGGCLIIKSNEFKKSRNCEKNSSGSSIVECILAKKNGYQSKRRIDNFHSIRFDERPSCNRRSSGKLQATSGDRLHRVGVEVENIPVAMRTLVITYASKWRETERPSLAHSSSKLNFWVCHKLKYETEENMWLNKWPIEWIQ